MDSKQNLELIDEEQISLPHIALLIPLFFILSGLINCISFKDIFLVSEGRPEDFVFKNFLIYNFGFKAILFPFKFIGLTMLLMLGAFLFKIEKLTFLDVLKVVIIAELIKYIPKVIKILWFLFLAPEDLVGNDVAALDDYFTLNGLIGITKENTIHTLLDYVSLVELCYILVVAKLLQISTGTEFSNHFRWSSITYFSFTFIMGLIFTLISL